MTSNKPRGGSAATPAVHKPNAWWRRKQAANGPRVTALIANDGEVFVGRRVGDAWVWIEAESVPAIAAANEAHDQAQEGGKDKT